MSQTTTQTTITQYDVVKIVGTSTADALSHQGLTGTAVDIMADGTVYFELSDEDFEQRGNATAVVHLNDLALVKRYTLPAGPNS